MKERAKKIIHGARARFGGGRKRVTYFVRQKPFASFFAILGLFILLIVISNILGTPKPVEKKETIEVKDIKVYTIGSAPRLTVQAQIEKSGTIRINALTAGVVQKIYKKEGERFVKGETLIGLSTNYQGGNSSSLQRRLAQTQYQNILDTYDTQKDLIGKQREVAHKTDANADELRNITNQSVNETKDLIKLNDEILKSLDQKIASLTSEDDIRAQKQIKSQFLAANNQAKQALRVAEYNAAGDKPPAQLSDLGRDIALRQLDVQEKMLELSKEVGKIQVQIATVMEAMMFPAAPFNGTVQRVFVKVGQQVNPGTELMVLSENIEEDPVIAIAYVSQEVAKKASRLEDSILHITDEIVYSASPYYVTQDAIQGSLYGIYFDIPDEYIDDVTERGFIQVDLPIGYVDTSAALPYIPVDAIYQTKEQNYVFVVEGDRAKAKSVTLGTVYGSFVEVARGLSNTDKIILNRNIIAGDRVHIQ